MLTLFYGLVLFFGVHLLQVLAPGWRERRRAQWGELPYKGIYSVVSLIGLVLLVQGYGLARAEPVALWQPPRGLLHLAWLLMWLAMVLVVAAYFPRNGIRRRLGHPMTLSVKVWALAHLLVNGNLADVLLFGSFLLWAVLVFRSARRRAPGAAQLAPSSSLATLATVLLGTALWAMFLWGGWHAQWIGVDPMGAAG